MSLYRDAETLRALEKETPRGLLLIYYNHFLEIPPTLSLSLFLPLSHSVSLSHSLLLSESVPLRDVVSLHSNRNAPTAE